MIYITGDTHGDVGRFALLCEKYGEDRWNAEDVLIVCGDFGYLFLNNEEENRFLDELARKPYTLCFVDGNHGNFDAINAYPVEPWNGGKVHRIRQNIFHLMRGQVFTIAGKTFFTMGGAYSVDKGLRTPGYTWWQAELPTGEEYREASENLKAHGMQVDYILTHTMPRELIRRLGVYPDNHDAELTGFLEWVLYEVRHTRWFCGHWHMERALTDSLRVLWFDVVCLGDG